MKKNGNPNLTPNLALNLLDDHSQDHPDLFISQNDWIKLRQNEKIKIEKNTRTTPPSEQKKTDASNTKKNRVKTTFEKMLQEYNSATRARHQLAPHHSRTPTSHVFFESAELDFIELPTITGRILRLQKPKKG